MHGGIFHSFCSFTVTFLVGECMTGAGGDGGPRGIFLLILQSQTFTLTHPVIVSVPSSISDDFHNSLIFTWYVLEFWRFQRIHLCLHHSDNPLLCTRIERLPLLRRCITYVLSWSLFLSASHGHSRRNLWSRYLFQRFLRLICEFVNFVIDRPLQSRIFLVCNFWR